MEEKNVEHRSGAEQGNRDTLYVVNGDELVDAGIVILPQIVHHQEKCFSTYVI